MTQLKIVLFNYEILVFLFLLNNNGKTIICDYYNLVKIIFKIYYRNNYNCYLLLYLKIFYIYTDV